MRRGALRFAGKTAAVAMAAYAAAYAICAAFPGVRFLATGLLLFGPLHLAFQLIVDLSTNRKNRDIGIGLERDPAKRVVVPRREVVSNYSWTVSTLGFAITGAPTAPVP